MSRITAVLFPGTESSWVQHITRKEQAKVGSNESVVTLSNLAFSRLRSGSRYFREAGIGQIAPLPYYGYLSCVYQQPISLAAPDAGPFFTKDSQIALTYDGIISGYTGQQITDRLRTKRTQGGWETSCQELDGQFSLLAHLRNIPYRIYYATKAKPLYMLYDSLGRGVIVSSDRDYLSGLYHLSRTPQPVELPPYSVGYVSLDGNVNVTASLIRFPGEGTLVLSGGGIDTLVAAYDTRCHNDGRIQLIYFDYGAKARMREINATISIANELERSYRDSNVFRIFSLPILKELVVSSLTNDELAILSTPQAGKASEWVPCRNTVLMSLAMAYAESYSFARIVTGINPDAATAYPDNDEEWNRRMQQVVPYALGADRYVHLEAPLSRLSKVEIIQRGSKLNVPWELSWSCYEDGDTHCGTCSSCRSRRKAFQLADVYDPTEYAKKD